MALDFPASPTVGQKYPSPAVSGVPVYSWDGEKWTTLGGALGSTGASDAIPLIDAGTGAAGSSTLWSRGDHAHPADPIPRAPVNNPVLTGDPKAPTPTAGDNDTSIATTAFVSGAISTAVGGIPGAPSAVVRYDIAQSLTAPQLIQARQNIYAAPFDAMAYGGLQINGAFDVSQEKGGVSTVASTTAQYVCDGWAVTKSGSMVTSTGVGNIGFASLGFSSALGMAVTTAQASLGAGDYSFVWQYIEGFRTARLAWGTPNAQPITIGFWSAHHRTGLYSVAARTANGSRCYVATYTQAVADVPQYNTITIPGDTTGTWVVDNTIGLQLAFATGAGSTFIAPSANTWLVGNYFAAPGQINGVAATTDVFRLTGVIVLPGNEAPSAARSPFVMRSYDQELALCRRYFWRSTGAYPSIYGAGYTATANVATNVALSMRASPTVAVVGTVQVTNCAQPLIGPIGPEGFLLNATATAAGNLSVIFNGTSSYVTADARL